MFFFLSFLFLAVTSQTSPVAAGLRADPDGENWDVGLLDTARDMDYLTGPEKDVILEMNKARTDPQKFAELYIRPRLHWFGGPFGDKSFLVPGNTVYTMSKEGKSAVQSCIGDLSRQKSLPPLKPEKGLYLAALDHVNDTGPEGITGHIGSNGSTMVQRIERYGKWDGYVGENISYGYKSGRDIVIQLLIDDGVPNRGHRQNIFNRNFRFTGAAIGAHSVYTSMCVIEYADEYNSE